MPNLADFELTLSVKVSVLKDAFGLLTQKEFEKLARRALDDRDEAGRSEPEVEMLTFAIERFVKDLAKTITLRHCEALTENRRDARALHADNREEVYVFSTPNVVRAGKEQI